MKQMLFMANCQGLAVSIFRSTGRLVRVNKVCHGNGLVEVLQKYDVSRVHDFKFGFAKSAPRFWCASVSIGKTDFFRKAKILQGGFNMARDVIVDVGRIHSECRLVKISMPQKY